MDLDSLSSSLPNEAEFKVALDVLSTEADKNKFQIIGWAAGAFVAFNAAGLGLSVSSIEKINHPRLTILLFFSTLVLSFITAALYAISQGNVSDHARLLGDHLNLPIETRDKNKLYDQLNKVKEYSEENNKALWVGLITTVMSVCAVTMLAADFEYADHDNDRRCEAIQRDMLSAKPRRADSPALFQALDCKAKGQGSVYAPPVKGQLRR